MFRRRNRASRQVCCRAPAEQPALLFWASSSWGSGVLGHELFQPADVVAAVEEIGGADDAAMHGMGVVNAVDPLPSSARRRRIMHSLRLRPCTISLAIRLS